MYKLILILIVIVISGLLLFKTESKSDENKNSLEIIPTEKVVRQIKFNNEVYEYSYFIVENPRKLSLIPNFDTKYSAKDLMDQNGCEYGINGGFYSENNSPIGEFFSDGMQISKYQKNNLFNGFIKIDQSHQFNIDYGLSSENARIFLQSGPVLVQNTKPIKLSLARDKKARRMVAIIDSEERLIFLTIFNSTSRLDGPLLDNLGELIQQIAEFKVQKAINLDGGSASAFYGPEVEIQEWQSVGSWWCYKN